MGRAVRLRRYRTTQGVDDASLIFSLATRDAGGTLRHFFVGAIDRPQRREWAELLSSHANMLYALSPDLECHTAQLAGAGATRGVVPLRECPLSQLEDVKRFEIIRLLREGHPLKNPDYMTDAGRAELATEVADTAIQSADDLARRRLAQIPTPRQLIEPAIAKLSRRANR